MSSSSGWLGPRIWRGDEEMAKKNDDLNLRRLSSSKPGGAQWQFARMPRRRSVVRLVVYVVVAAVFLLLFLRIAGAGSPSAERPGSGRRPGSLRQHKRPQSRPPSDPKADQLSRPPSWSGLATYGGDGRRDFRGPIKFLGLAASLRPIAATGGSSVRDQNVLFAAANLRSAAALLPMACQMASTGLGHVHFALMGGTDMSLQELLKVNGLDHTCQVTLHDARPDSATTSTEMRLTLAVGRALRGRALHHVDSYMHPQAILIDSTSVEESYFQLCMRDQVRTTGAALIELPEKPESHLSWITRLDASALAAWNTVRFDILIHSPPTGTGNLQRLLRSIAHADLTGHAVPHITVELPPTIEAPLEGFLASYQWPPSRPGQKQMARMLSLRHRIPRQRLTEEESSVRFLESFWPSDPRHSHVLVLSPHAEVAPQFFHYVKYALLSQRYSRAAAREGVHGRMLSMSFSIPTTTLDGTRPFTPPPPLGDEAGQARPWGTAFLWQAPACDAALFMGDKWVELHSYVSRMLELQRPTSARPALLAKKEVGKKYPAWMEYALQLSRLRGYYTYYPSKGTAGTMVGLHTDLPDEPEERQVASGERRRGGLVDEASKAFDAASQVDMLKALPDGGDQPLPNDLPLLAWDGTRQGGQRFEEDWTQYYAEFRRQVGQCTDEDGEQRSADKHVGDLFCNTSGGKA